MNFDQWLQLYTERMDDTPGLTQFGRESWEACKKEVLKILNQYYDGGDLDSVNKYDLLNTIERKVKAL